MGAMRKMAVYLGLVEDEAYDYADVDEDGYDTRSRYEEPRGYSSVREVRPEPRATTATATRTAEPAVRTARPVAAETAAMPRVESAEPVGMGELYRITTLHPRTYNDARRIGEEFREGVPVIMNLTEMDDVDAKRIVDFAAGLVFGCRGTIERVTNKVFLLSPLNVDVAAEARRLAQDGFFNQS
jgi:cell division inhibitor SepF